MLQLRLKSAAATAPSLPRSAPLRRSSVPDDPARVKRSAKRTARRRSRLPSACSVALFSLSRLELAQHCSAVRRPSPPGSARSCARGSSARTAAANQQDQEPRRHGIGVRDRPSRPLCAIGEGGYRAEAPPSFQRTLSTQPDRDPRADTPLGMRRRAAGSEGQRYDASMHLPV